MDEKSVRASSTSICGDFVCKGAGSKVCGKIARLSLVRFSAII